MLAHVPSFAGYWGTLDMAGLPTRLKHLSLRCVKSNMPLLITGNPAMVQWHSTRFMLAVPAWAPLVLANVVFMRGSSPSQGL